MSATASDKSSTNAQEVRQQRKVCDSGDVSPIGSTITQRFWEIDAARGIAIIMMVIYHLMYDLDYFGGFDINATGGFWRLFATATAFLFVFLVGVSLTVSHARNRAREKNELRLVGKVMQRGIRILGYAFLITLVLWFGTPDGNIFFGILHLIGLSIIFAYPFLNAPRFALGAGIGILLLGWLLPPLTSDNPWFLWAGIRGPVGYMFDYRPMIPWFGVALLGVAAGYWLYRDGQRQFPMPPNWQPLGSGALTTLGRYSLPIYLIHQPLLLGVLHLAGIIDLGIF